MDSQAFIRWSLDDSRTVEERYTVELLVELGVSRWNSRRKIYRQQSIDDSIARSRERELNPAYQPQYDEQAVVKAAEYLAEATALYLSSQRRIRDITALGFMTALEEVSMATCFEGTDIAALARLPALRKLALGHPGAVFWNSHCRDYTPLACCAALRDLTLGFNAHWPDFTGIERLTELETLSLSGNLLALPRGVAFPKVRMARLDCMPLASRDVGDLPQLPGCEFLTLSGAERLDGIGKMPALRNLTLLGPFDSFEPLVVLRELTCLTVAPVNHLDPEKMPRDVAPLARLPKLHFLKMGPPHHGLPELPRDYSPLTEAPALRELIVQHCPPVEMEVAAISAGLPPCDDLYLAPEPRAIPPLRMVIAPNTKHPRRGELELSPGETGLPDFGLRQCEGRWVGNYLQQHITRRMGHADWGTAKANGLRRALDFEIHSFECVGKLPLILQATREVMARLREDYLHATLAIHLRVPPPEDTPAQKELLEKFQEERDRWEFEQRERERQEYIERLHLLDLKKQEGAEIEPAEFSPNERAPYPEPPWEQETDDDEDDEGEGDVATKEKPAPPASWLDDGHPLAENYRLAGVLLFDEVWFYAHFRDVALYLMRREPDVEIPEDPKPGEI